MSDTWDDFKREIQARNARDGGLMRVEICEDSETALVRLGEAPGVVMIGTRLALAEHGAASMAEESARLRTQVVAARGEMVPRLQLEVSKPRLQ